MLSVLPTEILRNVFIYVDFLGLTMSIPLVCRRFRAIAKTVNAYPAESPEKPFTLHPIFSSIRIMWSRTFPLVPNWPSTDDIKAVGIFFPGTSRLIPIEKTRFLSENATLPSCGLAYTEVHWEEDSTTSWVSGESLTVKELLDEILNGVCITGVQFADQGRYPPGIDWPFGEDLAPVKMLTVDPSDDEIMLGCFKGVFKVSAVS